MEHIVRIHKDGKIIEEKVKTKTNLLKFLQKHNYAISAPCNGNKSCGKCKVKVTGQQDEPTKKEVQKLGEKELGEGMRLACFINVTSDMEVFLDKGAKNATPKKLYASMKRDDGTLCQHRTIYKKLIHLEENNEKRQDVKSAMGFFKEYKLRPTLRFLRGISKEGTDNAQITLCFSKKRVFDIEWGDTTKCLWAIAAIIKEDGTQVLLIDAVIGKIVEEGLIKVTGEGEQAFIHELNSWVEKMIDKRGIQKEYIYLASFLGNNRVLLDVLGIPYMDMSFINEMLQEHAFSPVEAGVLMNPLGYVRISPIASKGINSDILAAVAVSPMHKSKEISLFVHVENDVKIILKNRKNIAACINENNPQSVSEGIHKLLEYEKVEMEQIQRVYLCKESSRELIPSSLLPKIDLLEDAYRMGAVHAALSRHAVKTLKLLSRKMVVLK